MVSLKLFYGIVMAYEFLCQSGYCEDTPCFYDLFKTDCSYRNLTNIPSFSMEQNMRYIDFKGNVFVHLNSTFLTPLMGRRIEYLVLNYCQIQYLSPYTFQGMTYLERLYLEGNLLQNIGDFSFSGTSLQVLSLNTNLNLIQISNQAFTNSSVVELHLESSGLTSLNGTILAPLQLNLKVFHFKYNYNIKQICKELFHGYNFQTLNLRDNNFTCDIFPSFIKAETLDVSFNPLGKCLQDVIGQNDILKELFAENITLENFYNMTSKPTTKTLVLDGNSLVISTEEIFHIFPNLSSLSIKFSRLVQLSCAFLRKAAILSALDVTGNDITMINCKCLNTINLRYLVLSLNPVASLEISCLEPFKNLSILDLSFTKLHCNCEVEWLYTWMTSLQYGDTHVKDAKCYTPIRMPILQAKREYFHCNPPAVSTFTLRRLWDDALLVKCTAYGDPAPSIEIKTVEPFNLKGPSQTVKPHIYGFAIHFENIYINNFCASDFQTYSFSCKAENVAGTTIKNLQFSRTNSCEITCSYSEIIKVISSPETSTSQHITTPSAYCLNNSLVDLATFHDNMAFYNSLNSVIYQCNSCTSTASKNPSAGKHDPSSLLKEPKNVAMVIFWVVIAFTIFFAVGFLIYKCCRKVDIKSIRKKITQKQIYYVNNEGITAF